jgi:hypothetical protein
MTVASSSRRGWPFIDVRPVGFKAMTGQVSQLLIS